jgi:NAD(P)-dependent dehydrogenase (short-subunit alcohol dehydrogenase family)
MGKLIQKSILLAVAAVGAGIGIRTALRMRREYDLNNRVVLITGGSRGLGLLLAREFGRQSARIAICARDSEELARAKQDLAGYGIDAMTVTCDMTDVDQIESMIRDVRDRFGRIDVLVNNAGIIQVGPIGAMTEADFEQAMKLHFWAPLRAISAVVPEMRARYDGRIVNIASIGGKVGVPHLLPYVASKYALVGLSEGMRAELARYGIYVTTVCPGLMRTGSQENAEFKGQNQAEYAAFSLTSAMPGASMDAELAAKQIVAACRRGDPEIILSLPAQILAAMHGLFPGLTADTLGLVNRLLPTPGGIGESAAMGSDSHSVLAPSVLTQSLTAASLANNEI